MNVRDLFSMTTAQQNATDAAETFLAEHLELHPFKEIRDQLDRAKSALASVSDDAVRELARRLARCTHDAFFMGQVCSWKFFHLVRAFLSSLKSNNAVSLAAITRSMVEHVASLAFTCDALENLKRSIDGQNSKAKISTALERAEQRLKRSYYGYSPKWKEEDKLEAIHVEDCLDVLEKQVADIRDVYAYLCEYVHPNHGSNRMVSHGELGLGNLEPDPTELATTTDKIANYGVNAIATFSDVEIDIAKLCIVIDDLASRAKGRGVTLGNWLSKRSAKPRGDGKSKLTAYEFANARSAGEAIAMIYDFLSNEGIEVNKPKRIGGIEQGHIYDIFPTTKGDLWFRTLPSQ